VRDHAAEAGGVPTFYTVSTAWSDYHSSATSFLNQTLEAGGIALILGVAFLATPVTL